MNLFDILGPVMVGPSSSHTAGAVRIGRMARSLLGQEPVRAELFLHSSFASTGEGHGTHQALIAGLLGLSPDDDRVPGSFALREEPGLSFTFIHPDLRDVHPNSVLIRLEGDQGGQLEVGASSPGGRPHPGVPGGRAGHLLYRGPAYPGGPQLRPARLRQPSHRSAGTAGHQRGHPSAQPGWAGW